MNLDQSSRGERGGHATEAGAGATAADPDFPLIPVQPVRFVSQQVGAQLRSMIVSGQLPPGSRLPVETDLARRFGVSRGTIREALRSLADRQLIRTSKGST